MKNKITNKGVIIAIIAAAVLVSGSMIFFGFSMFKGKLSDQELSEKINKGIEAFVLKEQGNTQPQGQQEATLPKEIKGDLSDDDPVLGDKSAPISIVDFSDFQCPYCRSFYNETFSKIKQAYIDTGKVKFIYRDFPLSFHPDAMPAAMSAECVREQKGDKAYYEMHDKIFEGENKLGSGTVEIPKSSLDKYAKEIGVDMDKFQSCVKSEKYKSEIEADVEAGKKIGVGGTPSFVVAGKYIEGAEDFSTFQAIIDEALKK
ncbi:DsbA family protein [Candidatus Peregrinibacteria bacterium]|nr:DsbA family protein [Candidatus Peregrinibacteria bacterium]